MPIYKLQISPRYCENMTFTGETDNVKDAIISHTALIGEEYEPKIFRDGEEITRTMLVDDYRAYCENSPPAAD